MSTITIDKKQIQLDSINHIFDDYVKEFQTMGNMGTWINNQKNDLNKQVTINYLEIQTNKPKVAMVSLKQVTAIMKNQVKIANQKGLYRLAKTLNVILGDIQTLSATKIVCLGFDGNNFLLLKKEPLMDREESQYVFSISQEMFDNHIADTLFNSVQYLMTDQNIQDALNDEDLDSFINKKQRQGVIKNSIMTFDEFNNWEI